VWGSGRGEERRPDGKRMGPVKISEKRLRFLVVFLESVHKKSCSFFGFRKTDVDFRSAFADRSLGSGLFI
jgi:hypothetical protein